MSQNGKGSKPRPKCVDQKTWEKNYERIFRHEKCNKSQKSKT